jgi:hypothetical protein
MVRADWEFYKNALKGHYDSLALQSVQIQQATSHAKASLPAGMYVAVYSRCTRAYVHPLNVSGGLRVARYGALMVPWCSALMFIAAVLLGISVVLSAKIIRYKKLAVITFSIVNNVLMFLGVSRIHTLTRDAFTQSTSA